MELVLGVCGCWVCFGVRFPWFVISGTIYIESHDHVVSLNSVFIKKTTPTPMRATPTYYLGEA